MRTQNQPKRLSIRRPSFLLWLCFFLLATPFACRSSHAASPPTPTDDTSCADDIMTAATTPTTTTTATTTNQAPLRVLVVGATGATGRHVVAQLLQADHAVKVIVRSATRLEQVLKEIDPSLDTSTTALTVTEASLLELTDAELIQQTADVDMVISCLGHTISWKGIYGAPRKLVTEATQRLTAALSSHNNSDNKEPPKKFILMGSDGVADATVDDVRPWGERLVISLLRLLVPPHVDNEGAAAHLQNTQLAAAASTDSEDSAAPLEWVILRPTDLVDQVLEGAPPTYALYDRPQGSLFGSGTATRSHVAQAMVALATQPALWNTWKFRTPVLLDDTAPVTAE